MPDQHHWRRSTMGDAAQFLNGYPFKPADWAGQGTPIVRIAQMTGSLDGCDRYRGRLPEQFGIDNGNLLFSWSATLTALIWDRGPAFLNQHIFKVVPRDGTDVRFLHHLLNHHMNRLGGHSHGTTMRHIKRADLLPYEVDLPPLPEQHQIAAILDTLDDAIRKTEQIIAKLKQVKQGLLHDLLSRGIDDNGELRDPEGHPEQFKDSPLGRVPREWEVVRLDELAHNYDGRRIPLKQANRDRRHGIYPYYGASGIIDWIDDFIFDGDFVLLGEDGENVVSRQLPLAFRVTGKVWVNNHAHVFTPVEGVDIRFLVEVLEATDYARIVSGSAQPKLTQAGLAHLWFTRPPTAEQAQISEILAVQQRRAEAEAEVRGKLRLLKHGVMEDLLTSCVRVTKLLESAAE